MAFKAALWQLTQAIARQYPPATLPIQSLAAPQYKSDNEWTWVYQAVPQPQLIVGDLQMKLTRGESWPELVALLRVVEADDDLEYAFLRDAAGKPVPNKEWWLATSLRNFYADYFRAAGHEAWMGGHASFDQLVETLLVSIHTRRSRHTLWAPLYNASVEGETPLELASGVTAEEPPAQILIRLAGPLAYEPSQFAMRFPRYFLRLDDEFDLRRPLGPGSDVIQQCAMATRLVAGGRARVSEIYEVPHSGWLRGLGEVVYGVVGTHSFRINETVLSRSHVDDIRLVVKDLSRVGEQFPIPLRRFGLTAERQQHEDMLLDACIGLEGLLIPDRTSETSDLFALRGAWVLEADAKHRRAVYRGLKKMYDVRSRVVHANVKQLQKLGGVGVVAAADEAVERLRQLLRYVIASGMSASAWEEHVASAPLG